MNFEKYEILKSRLETYCNVNAFDLIALKANLELPDNAGFRETFRAELTEAIETDALPRVEYEKLTDDEFDDDDAYKAYLRGIRGYLFEGAPHP